MKLHDAFLKVSRPATILKIKVFKGIPKMQLGLFMFLKFRSNYFKGAFQCSSISGCFCKFFILFQSVLV